MCRWTLLLTLVPEFFASAEDETRQIFDTHFASGRVAVAPSAPRAAVERKRVTRPFSKLQPIENG